MKLPPTVVKNEDGEITEVIIEYVSTVKSPAGTTESAREVITKMKENVLNNSPALAELQDEIKERVEAKS